MMLYDVITKREKRAFTENCQVYDINNIMNDSNKLVLDRMNSMPIDSMPKRPPGDFVWLEYTPSLNNIVPDAIISLYGANLKILRPFFLHNNDIINAIDNHDSVYQLSVFLYIRKTKEIKFGSFSVIAYGDKDLIDPQVYLSETRRVSDYIDGNFPLSEEMAEVFFQQFFWFCALLNCKNITTRTIDPNVKPKVRNPRLRTKKKTTQPKTVYKILELDLLKTPEGVTTEGTGESVIKKRHHLCRGHFKHLKHERYKNPGWYWWPEHWKGSKDVGEVVKTYDVHATHTPI